MSKVKKRVEIAKDIKPKRVLLGHQNLILKI
jgi:hypothetical protein